MGRMNARDWAVRSGLVCVLAALVLFRACPPNADQLGQLVLDAKKINCEASTVLFAIDSMYQTMRCDTSQGWLDRPRCEARLCPGRP